MTTTITPEQANTLPAEAIDLDTLAELARKATPGPWIRSGIQQRMTEKSLGAGPDGRLLFFSPLGATNNDQAQCIRDMDFIAALDPQTVLALIDLARLAAVPSEQEPVAWRWRWKDQIETDGWCLSEVDPRPGSTPTRMERFDEVQPLYAHPAPAAGVKVKPLEWEPDHVGGGLRAGEYHLRPGLWTRGYYWLRGDDEPHTGYPDEDEAKAAAQADYEARILSALDTGEPK